MANILIIKLGALGDVVMSTSLIRHIQSFHASDNLFLLTSKSFKSLFHEWPDLTVHAVERKSFINTLSTIAWIRKHQFSTVYDLQSNDRTGMYCALSGIAIRIGNHPRYPYNVHPEDAYHGQCHIYDRMLTVLKSAGLQAQPSTPYLPASDEVNKHVVEWLRDHHLVEKNFIIIHAGGSKQHPQKRWPYYEQLATQLAVTKKAIVWVGGNDDLDINKQLSSIAGVDASNQFNYSELAELGRHAAFAITNDSGPMHILSCASIPVYAFFGPTNWKRNHAIQQQHNVIYAQSADEKSLAPEAVFGPVSLATISVNTVIDRFKVDGVL